ncbi:MAG: hypothetical protein HYX89_05235 [Chloroflexi bacterium]|nr:hypothetical protein [Chloroflexota bacterium]
MALYMIDSPHTEAECLRSLDEILANTPELLNACHFACHSGEHRSWAIIEKSSESEARNLVPSFLRSRAHVVMVEKQTPAQIAAYHKM